MTVELPSAPVDSIIRRQAGSLRVSAEATDRLARAIQDHGAAVAASAATVADADGRKTVMVPDMDTAIADSTLDLADPPDRDRDDLELPIAPVDRIARLDAPDRVRVSADARVALAAHLESYADTVAAGSATLARHADRRTIVGDDVATYLDLVE
jgi:histone H3/H4